jgi:TolA-binding protein
LKTLDRRERVLLLLLVALLLFVGVYYSSPLLSGGQAVLRSVGLLSDRSPSQQASESLENPDSVRDSVLDHYRRTLPDFIGGVDLVSAVDRAGWAGTFEVALETGGDSWIGTFQGKVFTDGMVQGTLSSESSGSDTWVFQSREGSLYLHNRDSKKYRLGNVRFREPPPFQLDLDDRGAVSLEEARSTQWRGHDVYELTLQSERGEGRLFVTRREPRRLLEFDWTSDSDWSRQFDYSDDNPNRLLAIRTYRDQNLVSSFRRTANDTRILEFRSRRERTSVELVRLRYAPTGEDLDLRMDVHRRMGEDPILEASGTLRTAKDRVESLTLEGKGTGWSGLESSLRLDVRAEKLTMADPRTESTVNRPQSYEGTDAGTVVRGLLSGSAEIQGTETSGNEGIRTAATDTPVRMRGESPVSPGDVQPTGRPDTAVTDTDGSRSKDTTDRKTRSRDKDSRAPEDSGETVVRSLQDGYPSATPPTGFTKAQRFYENGKLDQAARTLNNLADTFPESVNVQYLFGVVQLERGRREASKNHFRKVISLRHDPQLRAWSRVYLRILSDREPQS